MKIRRTISILIGVLLIALLAYKLFDVDMKNIPVYIDNINNLPDFLSLNLINQIIFYAFFGIKVLTILLIAIGGRKALIIGAILLPIVIGEFYLTNVTLNETIWTFEFAGIDGVLDFLTVGDYLILSGVVLLAIYWLVALIIIIANKAKTIGAKVVLLIIGVAPIVLYYVTELFVDGDIGSFVYDQWETVGVAVTYGLPLLITIMLLFSQRGRKKPPSKHIWFPVIESL